MHDPMPYANWCYLQVKYLSHATSTFILRVSRDHYRLLWAALTFMNAVPVKNGKDCTFKVVRVSGTIRKVEEEAIRRARAMILAAQDEMAGKAPGSLSALFGGSRDLATDATVGMDVDSSSDLDEGEIEDEG